jgi:hypothetical protein
MDLGFRCLNLAHSINQLIRPVSFYHRFIGVVRSNSVRNANCKLRANWPGVTSGNVI